MEEAGFPAGVINVVTHAPGEAVPIGDEFFERPEVRCINFTGSSATGRILAERAGRALKRCVLELGGYNPLILLADADLDYAVEAAAFAAFFPSGTDLHVGPEGAGRAADLRVVCGPADQAGRLPAGRRPGGGWHGDRAADQRDGVTGSPRHRPPAPPRRPPSSRSWPWRNSVAGSQPRRGWFGMGATGGADPGGGFPGAGAGCCAGAGAGFRDVAQALAAGRAAAAYLNSPPARDLDGRARGEALEALGAITSLLTGATNGILRRFDADDDHDTDGYATSAAWLAAKTHLGRKDAKAAVRQMRLLGRHPLLDDATASGAVTISWAKEIAGWTGRIDHEELQQDADRILLDAATAGADLDDLKQLAQAAYEAWREREPDPDDDPAGRVVVDRHLRLETTLDGAGRIGGDLTPECAAAVTAVIEALGKSRGPEDMRSPGQRYHDALQEGCELSRVSCRT
jgi:Aldehyde dehydrogenase family/Domain of unknown function (DUF222)